MSDEDEVVDFRHVVRSDRWGVRVIRALSDNFMYLIIDREAKVCAAVDAVEPEKVLAAAKEEGCEVSVVLTTHNHWDHSGGNAQIAKMLGSSVPIVGGRGDGVEAVTREVGDGDEIIVGTLKVRAIETPFHTKGHVCYYVDADEVRAVFTGDTLFVGGCGNLNAGTKAQLHTAFCKLGSLPKDTLVYVGHEYTNSSFKYALICEPGNPVLRAKAKWAQATVAAGKDTVPSTIEEEYATSPFMRAAHGLSDEITKLCGSKDPAEAIFWLRKDKSKR